MTTYETSVFWEPHPDGRRCVAEVIDLATGQVVHSRMVVVRSALVDDFERHYGADPEPLVERGLRQAIEDDRQALERGDRVP